MPNFYVNKNAQSNGDHEVHEVGTCPTPANTENRVALGFHASCSSAVTEAKKHYSQVNGCANCAPACHTS